MAASIPELQVALIHACTDGEIARVEKALLAGAKLDYVAVDSAGIQRPLFIAATYGHTKLFRLLLDRGAKLAEETSKGETVLLEAAKHDHVDIVAICLDADDTNDLDELLRRAVRAGAARTVQHLLAPMPLT
jgi:ankyrin repeat protein